MNLRPAPRVAWLGAAAILVAAALVALVAIVRGDFSDTDARILGSLATVLYTGGALFAGLATIDRGRPWIGWALAGLAPVSSVILIVAIWEFVDEGGEGPWRWAWSAVLAVLAGIMLTTALLLARTAAAKRLAYGAGAGAGLATLLSIIAIWAVDSGQGWIKTITALWILSVLAYVLVPVTDRFTRARPAAAERVLAALEGVELVATTATGSATFDPDLAPGERLMLRPAR